MSEQENQPPADVSPAEADRMRSAQWLRDRAAMTEYADDRPGQRRPGESVSGWVDRETRFYGAPTEPARKALDGENYQRSHAAHMAKVAAAEQAEAQRVEAARQAELTVAKAEYERMKAREDEDKVISWYRTRQSNAPGRL